MNKFPGNAKAAGWETTLKLLGSPKVIRCPAFYAEFYSPLSTLVP